MAEKHYLMTRFTKCTPRIKNTEKYYIFHSMKSLFLNTHDFCIHIILLAKKDLFQGTDACLETIETIAILTTLLPIVLTLQLSLSIMIIANVTTAIHQ